MSDKPEKIFVNGMIVKRTDKAPEWVVCNLSCKVEELIETLQEHASDGWVNIQVCTARSGKLYAEIDQWKPTQGTEAKVGMAQAKKAAAPAIDDLDAGDLPF